MGNDLSEEMQRLVQDNGDEVAIHTGHCVLWKAEHKNCSGCQYELGCSKAVHLMGIMLIPAMYQPKNYDDFAQMQQRIQELMDKTLKAKTVGELKAVPHQ